MANITKRESKDGTISYLIRVFINQTGTGHQVTKSMTWRPPENMRQTAAEKKVQKKAILFEDRVKKGLVSFNGTTKFEDYANQWVENHRMGERTQQSYQDLLVVIDRSLGEITLEKLQGELRHESPVCKTRIPI